MPKVIQDQFTDLPITHEKRWQLRHPDHYTEIKRAVNERQNEKKKGERAVKRRDFRNSQMKRDKLVSEAKRHEKRGRDIGQICIWMNLTESKVRELLAQKPVDTTPTPCQIPPVASIDNRP